MVVHAGLVPEIPAEKQHHGTMYRIRNIIETINEVEFLLQAITEVEGWSEDIPGL